MDTEKVKQLLADIRAGAIDQAEAKAQAGQAHDFLMAQVAECQELLAEVVRHQQGFRNVPDYIERMRKAHKPA